MIDALLELPSHLRERLASALETEVLPIPASEQAVRSLFGSLDYCNAIVKALGELHALGVSGRAAAVWIRATVRAESRQPRTDLVWSGPRAAGVHARDTRRAFEELIESAQRSVHVSTYAYFDAPKAFQLLAKQMDAVRSLRVMLLLNIQRKRGDTTATDHVVRQFADRFWSEWPGSARPLVFYDPRALDTGAPGGVLHAKALVVDDLAVFVTSANLTEAAFDRNIELGLLVRDRTLAASVTAHFQGLVDGRLLVPLPAA